jgi:hypothetical protein
MNESNKSIRELLREITKDKTVQNYSIAVKVVSVDETERICDVEPLNGDPLIYGVRLQSVIDGADGFVCIPAVDSVGIVTFINNNTGYLATCSKIDKLIVKSDVQILIDCDDIQFNGGANGGLIKINDLVSKLNAVENDLNTLKNIFTAWVPIPRDGGAKLKADATAWSTQTITPTQTTDIENDKIKH